MSELIDIEQVAPDQRDAIAAFRAAGGKSFQDAESVAVARENYEKSCAANGLPRDEVKIVEDVELGEGDERFTIRVYDNRAERNADDPVIVFFHGGGWVIGSRETHDPVCRRLATLTNLPVVAVDYRLGPEFRFPAAHLDCKRTVEWIRDNATERVWNPQRVATIGDSAGGGLANVLAFEPSLLVDGTAVTAQVLLYPMLDMKNETPAYERIAEGFPLTADSLRWFGENFLASDADRTDPRVSPMLAVKAGDAPQPPAFILSLGLDPLGEEDLNYAHKLAMNGTYVELVHLPRHAHGLFTSAGKIAAGEVMLERAAQFILQQA